MKNRTVLARHFKNLGFKIGAEIGVAQGIFSETICKENPGVILYCVDPWGPYPGYRDFARRGTFEKMIKEATNRLAPYNCIFKKKFSVDAAKDFKDGSLDFVFIDGNHQYGYVRDDIRAWAPKVRVGGIISGHDYYKTKSGNVGVINAVDEFVKENGYKLQLTRWDRGNHSVDERQPSWFFIKTK